MHRLIKVMGILNVTPDSFYDGGHYLALDKAVAQGLQLTAQGADIIDIGGESTRPFAQAISAQEECDRILPVLEQLKKETNTPISVDSRHTVVMKAALAAGADMINDVAALQDAGSLALLAAAQKPVCLMHMQGGPEAMQVHPFYEDVLQEIYDFFVERLAACAQAGIKREHIYLDPGFGFGKTLTHNLTLLGNLSFFKSLGCPLLVGLSRKSMFGILLKAKEKDRLHASTASALLACVQGAAIVRTHDVASVRDAVAVLEAVRPYWRQSSFEGREINVT